MIPWLDELAEDCRGIVTEGLFTARFTVIETYHALGKRIVTDEGWQKHSKGNGSCLSELTNNSGIGERVLYRAIQFYSKYPDLALLPGDKSMSWSKIVTNLLPAEAKSAKEASAWTKAKTLMTVDLEGCSRTLRETLITWREETDEIYEKWNNEKRG